jgi:hypothetical protein
LPIHAKKYGDQYAMARSHGWSLALGKQIFPAFQAILDEILVGRRGTIVKYMVHLPTRGAMLGWGMHSPDLPEPAFVCRSIRTNLNT